MAAKPATGATRGKRATKPPKWVLHELWLEQHGDEFRAGLFRNIKEHVPGSEALRVELDAQWPKDRVFPFDSRSFADYYRVQPLIPKIAAALQDLLPDRPMRKHFCKIVAEGTGREFAASDLVKRSRDARTISDALARAYY